MCRLVVIWLFVCLGSCTDSGTGVAGDPSDVSYSDLDIYYQDTPSGTETTDSVEDTYSIHTDPCVDCAYYFCPPLNAVWQKQICINNCDDPPTVVYEGECVEYLQCDPTQKVMETDLPCVTPDGYPGTQSKLCNKGQIQYTDCETDCEEEVCDGKDNDCDGDIDEGFTEVVEVCNNLDDNCNGVVDEDIVGPCENECGVGEFVCVAGQEVCFGPLPEEETCNGLDDDCDGETDEGQLNACGECGDVPEEVCNGLDDDCNGEVDEDLIQACATECEEGYQLCLGGSWSPCSAQEPMEEVCDGLDNDCDELVDEGLDCQCPPETIGFLIPCMEEPLVCGQGYKTCQCVDEACTGTTMTPCYAACWWTPPEPEPGCDPTGGFPIPELCNNFDDDCDVLVDEDLATQCYTGDEGTLNVGICHAGDLVCEAGKWGNYPEGSSVFVEEYCLGQQTPLEEDLCSGQDDNCDGVIDKEIEKTDILFIVDTSGSMSNTINAVQSAMSMFASTYSDEEVIHWGLVIGPVDDGYDESLQIATGLVPFQQFLPHLTAVSASYSTGSEMLYDAVYLSLLGLVDPADVLMVPTSWDQGITSTPSLGGFKINWREDANRVVVVFTDEDGQSYLNPPVQQELIKTTAQGIDDLFIYTFSTYSGKGDWEPVSVGGSWYELTTSPTKMFDNLMTILNETACGEAAP